MSEKEESQIKMIDSVVKEIEAQETGNSTVKCSIETTEDEESEEVLYLMNNLSPRAKRRTLLKLQPLMSSTVMDTQMSHEQQMENRTVPERFHSEGNILKVGDSTITVKSISGNSTAAKLRHFSGIVPVPSGQISFNTWFHAATRLCRNEELSTDEMIARIHNSLSQPALDIAQSALDSGTPNSVLQLLQSAFGSVDDPRDLMNDYNATMMKSKEKPSEYLNRLYIKLEELKQHRIVDVTDGPTHLLKQFIYGCSDDALILKLRLEEKEDTPPDYGTLLLSLRKEEAKRTKRPCNEVCSSTSAVYRNGK